MGILHPPATSISLSILLSLLAPSKQETRRYSQQAEARARLSPHPPLRPQQRRLGSSPSLSTKEGHRGDGVSAPSCRLCISKLSSISLLPWEAFTSAGHGRISGCPQYPSLWDGRLLTKLSLSLESCPLLELFLRGQLAILRSARLGVRRSLRCSHFCHQQAG